MIDAPTIGHNRPPLTPLTDLVSETVIAEHIADALAYEPPSPSGGTLKTIPARETELVGMCERLLAAHPTIETDETEAVFTQAFSEIADFAGGSGRIEKVREALKRPVWNAGKQIDAAFGKIGTQLEIRPASGKGSRQAPFTLAERLNQILATYKDAKATEIRAAALAEAKAKAEQAALFESMAAREGSSVTMGDAAEAQKAAEAYQAIANTPVNELTRSRGQNFGSTSLRYVRVVTVINPGLVPRIHCVPSDALLREAAGKPGTPIPTIAGVTIVDVPDNNRR